MFLFPILSLLVFFLYIQIVALIATPVAGAYLLGLSLDFPLLVAIATAIKFRNTPIAFCLTFLSIYWYRLRGRCLDFL